MAVLSGAAVLPSTPSTFRSSLSASLKPVEQCVGSVVPTNLPFGLRRSGKSSISCRELAVHASYSDGERPGNGSIFMGGFVLGGLIVGTLGYVYAPQIHKVLAEADKKDLVKKLPKFIYDEEKALEKQRKKLAEEIEQLNKAIDDVSGQLRPDGDTNGAAVNFDDEVEEAAV